MKEISFTVSGFIAGKSYYAELVKDGITFQTVQNLVNGQIVEFLISVPGTYTIRVVESGGACISTQTVQALFPTVEFNETGVDCISNTYTFEILLTNPLTAGSNVQYGFSFSNNCTSVSNWDSANSIIVPADDIERWFFVKNDSGCCNLVGSTVKSPCALCSLQVSGITFNCN